MSITDDEMSCYDREPRSLVAASSRCSKCGYKFEAHTGVNGAAVPADGDVSVCLSCGDLGFFVLVAWKTLVRTATDAERDQLVQDPNIRQILAVRSVRVGDQLRPKQ